MSVTQKALKGDISAIQITCCSSERGNMSAEARGDNKAKPEDGIRIHPVETRTVTFQETECMRKGTEVGREQDM